MSLEKAIKDCTAAIKELTDHLKNPAMSAGEVVPFKPEEVPPEPPPEEEKKQLTYKKDVAPPALKLIEAEGDEALLLILEEFGTDKATRLKEDQWPEFIERVNAELR